MFVYLFLLLSSNFLFPLLLHSPPQTATKGPDDDANAIKSENETTKIDESNNDRPRLKQSNSISTTTRSPLNITDRPPSTLSSTSSFRNPFTDDDDSECATSTGATWNPFKHSVSNTSTNETPGPFGQPAWPSMYDHRVYDHLPKNTPIICPSHAFHDQQSHIYYSHAPPPPPPPSAAAGSASYVIPGHPAPPPHPPPPGHPSAQVCAHGCGCQGYSAPPGAYPCWPPPPLPPPHPMYCQMHPPGIPGHPQMHCVYCRSAAPAYHTHHPVPHPQSQGPLQPQAPLPAPALHPQVTPLPPSAPASAPVTESAAPAPVTSTATATATSNAPSIASRSQWPSQPTLGPTEFGSSFDFDDDEPLSPPERNIFQHKDDPFADDDFFAQ